MKRNRKVLIIKTGFSEVLDTGISAVVSLGDVLFCTMLLHLFKRDEVTWLTSQSGKPLLDDNPYINELLVFSGATLERLRRRSYDVLINLEKDIGICAFLKQVTARQRYGFYFDERTHNIGTYKSATRLLLMGQENHRNLYNNTAEILYQVVGEKWQGQSSLLWRKQRKKEVYDIGLNYAVGSKWPTKAWPMKHWKMLEALLKKDFSVSWQTGHKNIKKYINWIDSCRVLVTPDSLGQIIGHALGKEVISLWGPTNYRRMKRIPHVHVFPSTLKCPHRPCYLPICKYKKFCMEAIAPKDIAALVRRLLS